MHSAFRKLLKVCFNSCCPAILVSNDFSSCIEFACCCFVVFPRTTRYFEFAMLRFSVGRSVGYEAKYLMGIELLCMEVFVMQSGSEAH